MLRSDPRPRAPCRSAASCRAQQTTRWPGPSARSTPHAGSTSRCWPPAAASTSTKCSHCSRPPAMTRPASACSTTWISTARTSRPRRLQAAILRERCRATDLVARYGGEEFCIAFLETDVALAARSCEALREAIAAHDWASVREGLVVTMSIGVATRRPASNACWPMPTPSSTAPSTTASTGCAGPRPIRIRFQSTGSRRSP